MQDKSLNQRDKQLTHEGKTHENMQPTRTTKSRDPRDLADSLLYFFYLVRQIMVNAKIACHDVSTLRIFFFTNFLNN